MAVPEIVKGYQIFVYVGMKQELSKDCFAFSQCIVRGNILCEHQLSKVKVLTSPER